jgi:peptide deformylase
MDKRQGIDPLEELVYLGDSRLYQVFPMVTREEMNLVPLWCEGMHKVIIAIRKKYGFGRAIAAPQLGIMKRMVYMFTDQPYVFINPIIENPSEELMELWDNCMSFPQLDVRVRRHAGITVRYFDEHWQEQIWKMEGDYSELLQHEIDHLDGILCTMRAVDEKAFRWRKSF